MNIKTGVVGGDKNTGTYGQSGATAPWKLHLGAGGRDQVIKIKFDSPCHKPPVVIVALNHLDTDQGDGMRVTVSVDEQSITKNGFDVIFRTWGPTKLYGASATWAAFAPII
jgi:H-type lectin domain